VHPQESPTPVSASALHADSNAPHSTEHGGKEADNGAAVNGGTHTAAFFDVDNTIIRGASAFYLAKALYRNGFFRTRDILTFAVKQLRYVTRGENGRDIETLRNRALAIMQGHSVAEVVAIGEDVWDQVLANRIYPGTQKLLNAHIAQGHEVWLVTATPAEIGNLIARRLGATGALATVAEHDAFGFYTGRLSGPMMHGAVKADSAEKLAEQRGLDLSQCFAYGDSMNDSALLSAVGHPCAINPDRHLRQHATALGWPTRDFRSGRAAVKRSATAASVSGALWVIGLMIRRLRRR